MKTNEIIARLEKWADRLGYSTKQGELSEIIKDLREEAKVFSSNAVLSDSSQFSQQDKEDAILLLNRLKYISIMHTDEWEIKTMLKLIASTGFEIRRKR